MDWVAAIFGGMIGAVLYRLILKLRKQEWNGDGTYSNSTGIPKLYK